jgi:protein-L-isoaspartate(D-aspartate) O-methyltransferase
MVLVAHYQEKHQKMLREIKEEIDATAISTGIRHLSPKVLKALSQVPRHLFVLPGDEHSAYLNTPLPIGEGQTISQPFIVALMTELLDVQPKDKILEIGTGSGYQAAILAHLAKEIYTVEVVSSLARSAQIKFDDLQYNNIYVLKGDGAQGWVEHAPYNKIIVTAAAESIPFKLLEQLKNDGTMVIPLGKERDKQFLTVVNKDAKDNITYKSVLAVMFVPFT